MMLADLTWTGQRLLTFSERIRLTWTLFSLGLPARGMWMRIVWRNGALASSYLIDQDCVRLRIESEKRQEYLDVDIRKRTLVTLL
jgi:hypothetical protein